MLSKAINQNRVASKCGVLAILSINQSNSIKLSRVNNGLLAY